MDKNLLVFLAFAIMLMTFAGMVHSDKLKHECRIEALKALQNPEMIEKICQ